MNHQQNRQQRGGNSSSVDGQGNAGWGVGSERRQRRVRDSRNVQGQSVEDAQRGLEYTTRGWRPVRPVDPRHWSVRARGA